MKIIGKIVKKIISFKNFNFGDLENLLLIYLFQQNDLINM